jgi:cell fate regulator YaaT (PSP1 superfamily)
MDKVVSVSVRPEGRVCNYDAGLFVLSPGTPVIVETGKGLQFGTVVSPPRQATEQESEVSLKKIHRMANDKDTAQNEKNLELEKTSHDYCVQRIEELGLEMNLVSVESLFDGSKLTFYFTADGRVDFRELVKILIKAYRVRIELRQIGVRNRAKICGGIGRCGHQLCCSVFMKDFDPVSIRMAKEQGLLLNPTKISGLCGRLMCCLAFEHKSYLKLRRNFPASGKQVKTKQGTGKVLRQNLLNESITIKTKEGQEIDVGLKDVVKEKNA